jgi:hypothetical protein
MNYIHHVPGRIRVRIPRIKKNAVQAEVVTAFLNSLPSVKTTRVNLLTGSVLVEYQAGAVTGMAILTALRERRYIDSVLEANSAPVSRPAVESLGQKAARALFWYAVEKAVERSVPALVAALI